MDLDPDVKEFPVVQCLSRKQLMSSSNSNINSAVGSQEIFREIRAADSDDPVNCVLGGFASGGLIGRMQGILYFGPYVR